MLSNISAVILILYFEHEPQIFWKCGSERRYECIPLVYTHKDILFKYFVFTEILKDKNKNQKYIIKHFKNIYSEEGIWGRKYLKVFHSLQSPEILSVGEHQLVTIASCSNIQYLDLIPSLVLGKR